MSEHRTFWFSRNLSPSRHAIAWLLAVTAFILSCPGTVLAVAKSILDSPHNLSSGSTAAIHSTTEERICIFCHTPHHARNEGPLWSRDINPNVYTTYFTKTLSAATSQPQGTSRLCLSCHDGTIALGAGANPFTSAALPALNSYLAPDLPNSTNLGLDLRNDHPISLPYGMKPAEFHPAEAVRLDGIKLSGTPGSYTVECTACHDPHNNEFGKFLVKDMGPTAAHRDALCTTCHNKAGWQSSAHQTGGTKYPGVSPIADVARDGCLKCHTLHGAQQGTYLLTLSAGNSPLDTNCLANCHNGAPYSNIQSQFNSMARSHKLTWDAPVSRHLETETLPLSDADKHVHCVDCHNPHQAAWQDPPLPPGAAPAVAGTLLQGMRGVDFGLAAVANADYEWQVCFKCHAGAYAAGGFFNEPSSPLRPQRLFESFDQSRRFDTNPLRTVSFHPVAFPGSGNIANLRFDRRPPTGMIYCNDCHAPHGSSQPHMLRYANDDTYPAIGESYPLCFSCHDEGYLTNNVTSGTLHAKHITGNHGPTFTSYRAPCSACHDPHGVPGLSSANPSNASFLVNFDRRYTGSDPRVAFSATSVPRSCWVGGPSGPGAVACHSSGKEFQTYP